MTFSIVARSTDGTSWGVAVASKFLAVGAAVPAAAADAGALATQAFANLTYRGDGLRQLAAGGAADDVVAALTGADDGRASRQLGVVDRAGGSATYTGEDCSAWAGGRTGDGWAAQGNILTGPEVVDAMAEAYEGAGGPLARRLLASLTAGDRAGGDRRGRQSAALLVVAPGGGYGGGSDVLVDLRVDDHPDPVGELARLLDLHDLYFGKPESTLPLTGELAAEVADRLRRLGYASLEDWAGVENYEERLVDGAIDPVVLEQLPERHGVSVLAVDVGTTGVTSLVVSEAGVVLSRGYQEFPQHFPQPGWVEHEPEEIWQAVLASCRTALASLSGDSPTCLGLTNQRETAVLWDRRTLAAPRRAVVWQDRRTSGICDRLREAGHEPRLAELTGLRLDPYFTATKLTWLAEHDPRSWHGVLDGSTAVGTVDAYVIARLTAGARHVTDASNASRTLLLDLRTGAWSEELCALFGVPMTALPEVVPSWGEVGRTDPTAFLGLDLPIAGIAGDQQAALFGQGCYEPGRSKCTYGTGSFVLVNTGTTPVLSERLLTTVAWMQPGGELTYALEGSIFVTGAAVQWLRDGLQVIGAAGHVEALAQQVPDSGGVVFVPALTGLGAPHWDAGARGTVFGITRGTTRAHLARATLDAIAFEVRDVVEAMTGEAGVEVPTLQVDGGASANDLLCQTQADQLGVPVQRPEVLETTALGAAFLAGLGTGVWSSHDELVDVWRLDRRFEPTRGVRDDGTYGRWLRAVERARGWEE